MTENQLWLEGKVRWVHVIPSVDEAAMVPPEATATNRFWPVVVVAVVACTYTFPVTCNFWDGALVPMPTFPALVMMKFDPAVVENCTTFPVVLDPMTVRAFASAAGGPLAVIVGALTSVKLKAPTVVVFLELYTVSAIILVAWILILIEKGAQTKLPGGRDHRVEDADVC